MIIMMAPSNILIIQTGKQKNIDWSPPKSSHDFNVNVVTTRVVESDPQSLFGLRLLISIMISFNEASSTT